MNRAVSIDAGLHKEPSERRGPVRLVALWPLPLVVVIVAFVAGSSDVTLPPDQHMLSPYLQAGMAP